MATPRNSQSYTQCNVGILAFPSIPIYLNETLDYGRVGLDGLRSIASGNRGGDRLEAIGTPARADHVLSPSPQTLPLGE